MSFLEEKSFNYVLYKRRIEILNKQPRAKPCGAFERLGAQWHAGCYYAVVVNFPTSHRGAPLPQPLTTSDVIRARLRRTSSAPEMNSTIVQ